ncbi:hypothetical protein M426DRAFT_318153 [Hypoxylon sp. CI-4A]|nr:hypothetical protein M426DRAFT_318153 [Hypoxylon sp. CI-4A]
MWLPPGGRCLIAAISPLLLLANGALAQPDSSASTPHDVAKSASNTATAEPTCESRTVNYITHILPQQCLTTAPSPFPTPESVDATITPSSATAESTVSATDNASTIGHEEELDEDGNDLTTGSFMSFEEWKAMMLEKSGQEALEPRNRKTKETHGEYPGGEDFDSLGDEGEVSFDFDAYSDRISEIASSTRPSQKEKENERQVEKVTYDEGLAQGYRSKDAGKTCKERFSYASFDAGATVKKSSSGAKNPKSILVENKDSYMLLECQMENKFVIVELTDDILVDTIVLANFEFFSSMIRHFRVSVSDRYPVKLEKWKILGTFEARNSRDIQPFLVENPQIWAKYVRIEFLTHYGNEYYCPVSLLRVHGTRMLDSWKEADPADLEVEDDSSKTIPESTEETIEVTETQPEEVEITEPPQAEIPVLSLEQSGFVPYWDKSYFLYYYPLNSTCALTETEWFTSQLDDDVSHNTTAEQSRSVRTAEQTASVGSSVSSSGASTTQSSSQATADSGKSTASMSSGDTSTTPTAIPNATESTSIQTSSPDQRPSSTPTATSTPTTITPPSLPKTPPSAQSKSKSPAPTSVKPPSSRSTVASNKNQASGTPTTTTRNNSNNNKTSSTTSSAAAGPTVQDSFFKALNKRIQALEGNTTLSLQYIESQSRFLQEALARLERRQVAKVDLFLDTLNRTVLGELRAVRVQYDQVWQSTVIALESQREQSEREIVALSSRLGVLADEVVFQKRMAIVQSLLLLGCLVLVIFSRGGIAGPAFDASSFSYYPAQFLGGVGGGGSRIASPIFPSTPRAEDRPTKDNHHHHHHQREHETTPNTAQLLSVDDASPQPRLRRSPSETPDSSMRHRPRRDSMVGGVDGAETPDSAAGRRRPSPNRVSTEPAATSAGYYRAATPSSMDIGYDSEPALTPVRDRDRDDRGDGDYYVSDGGDTAAEKGSVPQNLYPEALARKSERQLTPSSETEGMGYMPLSSRPPLTHSTSARKPLPALPEDPD